MAFPLTVHRSQGGSPTVFFWVTRGVVALLHKSPMGHSCVSCIAHGAPTWLPYGSAMDRQPRFDKQWFRTVLVVLNHGFVALAQHDTQCAVHNTSGFSPNTSRVALGRHCWCVGAGGVVKWLSGERCLLGDAGRQCSPYGLVPCIFNGIYIVLALCLVSYVTCACASIAKCV